VKRVLILTLIITMLFSIFGIFPKTAFGDVEITNIVIEPNDLDKIAEFTILFKPHSLTSANQTISIKFPVECVVPDTISPLSVNISRYPVSSPPTNVEVIKPQNIVVLTIPFSIIILEPTSIVFYLNAKIRTPQLPSTYTLTMWTSVEPNPVETPFTIGSSSGVKVSGLQALVNPPDGGTIADYDISFVVSNEGFLIAQQNDYVDIYFPKGTTFPSKIDPLKVLMKYNQCEHIEIDKQRVRVYVPSSLSFIAPGGSCNVRFLKEFGIKNTLIPGYYSVQVATSKDTGIAVSNPFLIVGTQVSSATLLVNPTTQLSPAKYTLKFKTSVTKKLTANFDQIFIEFPADVNIPSNIIPGAILVNDTPCVSVSLNSQTLQITTPVNIYENSDVTVEIGINFGIKNPSLTGNYTVKLYTITDSMPVSLNFTVTSSIISKPEVVLSSTSAGQISKYTITFTTGASGELLAGIDKINIIFPIGTTMPSSIQTSSVTVNNIPTTSVEVNGTTVTITVPITIPANNSLTVMISESAYIKNPVQAGPYSLFVNTSKEQSSIQSSPYIISSTPVTTITISPAQPDGLNGFYISRPKIMLSSVSAIDSNPTIYYYFDSNAPSIFAGTQISAPEGVHIFYYYAVDNQGHQEKTSSIQFKIDTIPPQIVVIFPQDNSVLNSKTLVVKGAVDVGSTVMVNGNAATIDGLGNFEASVEVLSSPQIINISATDPAGNSSQKVLTVYLDTTPPNLIVVKPVMFQQVSKLPLIIEGITEKGAKVTVNGDSAEVREDGVFSYSLLNLSEGQFAVIEVIAIDEAGNSTKKTVSVKYSKSIIMKLQVGNKNALINNETYSLEVAPTITSGRTMVPLRFVGEAFGAEFAYDPVFKIIDINFGSDRIKMQIGKNIAFVNGKEVALDVAPYIVNGRTLVPIRFISETFGAEVVWDGTTKTVTIVYPEQ